MGILERYFISMSLKELIYAEISKIEEDKLDELYEFVKRFAN